VVPFRSLADHSKEYQFYLFTIAPSFVDQTVDPENPTSKGNIMKADGSKKRE